MTTLQILILLAGAGLILLFLASNISRIAKEAKDRRDAYQAKKEYDAKASKNSLRGLTFGEFQKVRNKQKEARGLKRFVFRVKYKRLEDAEPQNALWGFHCINEDNAKRKCINRLKKVAGFGASIKIDLVK